MKYPSHLLKIIDSLRRLPGVGSRSAERFAFHMLDWPPERLREMAQIIQDMPLKLAACSACGCLSEEATCVFCEEKRTKEGKICLIESARDAFAIEATKQYAGLYHVLGGLLSPLQGIGPEKLRLAQLKERVGAFQIREAIIALDATLEGDATSLYIKKELEPLGVQVSRLAFGLPMGSSLDYVDGGTLARAFSGRGLF